MRTLRKYNPIRLFAAVAVFAMVFGLLAPASVGAETIQVTDGMALTCSYGPCDIKQNSLIGGSDGFAWNQEDRFVSVQTDDSDSDGDTTSNTDYGDFNCTGPACGFPLEGSASYTNGTVLDPEWLASGQTGVGKKEVGWHVRVPEGYFLVLDAFEAHVAGTTVHGASGVHAAVGPGEYDVMMVDGALGVIAERSAQDNLCLRFTENAGRARDLVFTPNAWGENPCGIGEEDYDNDYVQPGDPDADYTDGQITPVADDGSGGGSDDGTDTIDDGTGSPDPTDDGGDSGNGGERTITGDGETRTFNTGDRVAGVDIVLDDGTAYKAGEGDGNCYFESAPQGGSVTTGVIHPVWVDEGGPDVKPDHECGS